MTYDKRLAQALEYLLYLCSCEDIDIEEASEKIAAYYKVDGSTLLTQHNAQH
jgi:hypothetical protein